MADTVVSSPGKVLLAGGYLVLERPNIGLVVSVNSRVRVKVSFAEPSSLGLITVSSPRFDYTQQFSFDRRDGFVLRPVDEQSPNKFIYYSLWFSFAYASIASGEAIARLQHGLTVEIRGDEAFYSNGGKSGLGSSAALTAALVGGLLQHLGVFSVEQVHKVAQTAHATAQGKLGSGFDIAAAVFGTGTYVRFTEALLRPIMAKADEGLLPVDAVENLFVHTHWDHSHSGFALPPGVSLMLGAVAGGSNTPGMVTLVLKWKRDRAEEAMPAWSALAEKNVLLGKMFAELHAASQTSPRDYANALSLCASTPQAEWEKHTDAPLVPLFSRLRDEFYAIRENLRRLNQSGAEVEPPAQTVLCDAVMQTPGCWIAGVPGAGGFDAIFALALSAAARDRVLALWAESGVTALDVSSDGEGIRMESRF